MPDYTSLKDMIIDGNEDAPSVVRDMLDGGAPAREILEEGLLPGIQVVGQQMKSGEKFVPEVLLSAYTMEECLDILRPTLGEGTGGIGKVVIGTVEGDIHDIGKNLVAMLLDGAGFEVVNLGNGITAAQFVQAVKEHNADIVGMSALLTTTIVRMPQTIQALKDAGLRDKVKVVVGGAPVSPEWAAEIGADAYAENASVGVERCKELMA